MVSVRFIRVLTVQSKTHFFLDGAHERGLAVEVARALEAFVNKRFKSGRKPIKVMVIPVRRDQLLPLLIEGRGDLAMGNLTVTEQRQEVVDFTRPIFTGVHELWVTGPEAPSPSSLDDLSGREVWVRVGSRNGTAFPFVRGGYLHRPVPLPVANEVAGLRSLGIDWIVTRNTGGGAGAALVAAARRLSIPVGMVRRPPQPEAPRINTVSEALAWVRRRL